MSYATSQDKKNSRGLNLLRSWLSALDIAFVSAPAQTADLAVTAKGGDVVMVQVNAPDSPKALAGTVVIKSGDLTGRNISKALKTFADLVATLGFEYREPVSRGALPSQKLNYRDNFEEVALRHTELRRCPNPSDAELKKCDTAIKDVVRHFMHTNHLFCEMNLLQAQDLHTYAQMWTISYLGMYQIVDPMEGNNEGKLRRYLRQRLMEYKTISKKKGRNMLVPPQDAKRYTEMITQEDDSEEIDLAYLERHNELSLRSAPARRDSATRLLEQKLREMPHDEMIQLLGDTYQNSHLHPDARGEALRRLNYHQQTCSTCATVGVVVGDDIIPMGGIAKGSGAGRAHSPELENELLTYSLEEDLLGCDEGEEVAGIEDGGF